jgi:hypothetical protein
VSETHHRRLGCEHADIALGPIPVRRHESSLAATFLYLDEAAGSFLPANSSFFRSHGLTSLKEARVLSGVLLEAQRDR